MPETLTLSTDAYELLEARRVDGESFSEVVRRLASDSTLADYHGSLSEETADELDRIVEERRTT